MTGKHRTALLMALLFATSSASRILGQESDSVFIDRVDVNIVNVEVWVTDEDGRRVQGLEQDDFELLEDGVPVEITNFYATARETPYADLIGAGEAAASAAGESMDEEAFTPPDQRLHLVVFVDSFNSLPGNRNRALDDLEPFLEDRLRQGDRVMLVGFDPSISTVQPFTADQGAIRDGLAELRRAPSQKAIQDAERRRRIRSIMTAWQVGDAQSAYGFVRDQVRQDEQEIRQTARAFEVVLRSLAGLPGRKAILYLSDGLPKRPGESLYRQYGDLFDTVPGGGDPFLEALRQDQAPLLNRLAREANSQQVTLYTIDTSGTTGASTKSPEYTDLSTAPGGNTGLAAARTLNYQETMLDIADGTGGSSIINTESYERALTAVAQDFDVFYSLGYAARQTGETGFREIEVRVKQPGLRVRHRRGYVAKPAEERVADRTLSSLILDMEKNSLGVAIDFGEPEKQSRRAFHLPVLIRVPLDNLTLLANGNVQEGRLRIFLAVKDESGVSDMQEFEYPISVPEEVASLDQQEIGYTALLKIGPGTPTVAIGVWDELSGTDSFVHKQVLVGQSAN
jgi:VWFA-related protein